MGARGDLVAHARNTGAPVEAQLVSGYPERA